MIAIQHQYIERHTGKICTEPLLWDRSIRILYTEVREYAPRLFRALVSPHASRILGFINFDLPVGRTTTGFMKSCGVNLDECLQDPKTLDTARKIFERQIRYWECRPMTEDPSAVVSPADARVIVGSLDEVSSLFVKNKFFHFTELLGTDKGQWHEEFRDGDFAVLRLTPDKYHYNHAPVAGVVRDFYEIDGGCHSCNPSAVVSLVTPFSKNKRVVTIIDTDVPEGTGVGLVAMIEVAALMVGEVVQQYSERGYDDPRPVSVGMFLQKGLPKSLYRPGSSTDVLLFRKDQVRFAEDIVDNLRRLGIASRFSAGFGQPLVETDVKVRSVIAAGVKE